MAAQGSQPAKPGNQLQTFVERYQALPERTRYILLGVVAFFVFMFLLRLGGDDEPAPRPQSQQPVNTEQQGSTARTRDAVAAQFAGADDTFSGVDVDRPALIQRWMQQQQQTLSDLQENMESRFQIMQEENATDREELIEMRTEIRQLIRTFQDEIKTLESSNVRDRNVLAKLAEETRKLQLQSPMQNGDNSLQVRDRGRISQTPLSRGISAPGGSNTVGQPVLGKVINNVNNNLNNNNVNNNNVNNKTQKPNPFIPPIGFVKGTLINGVDALVGGGSGVSTPALVRLSGNYKTAMNSTVSLNGCFVTVVFDGDASTERAIGRPERMTCVYPDRGAVTYSVSGYVVDARDGLVGVPGVFYEGNASALAAAMVADFVAGLTAAVESNQSTTTTNSDGDSTSSLTGSELRAQIAGGANQSISSLRDYLMSRAESQAPFIRVDATRDIHIVFMSGVELRPEGESWTNMFNGGN